MLSKKLKTILFGSSAQLQFPKGIIQKLVIPRVNEVPITFEYAVSKGFLITIFEKQLELEDRIKLLESNKKKNA